MTSALPEVLEKLERVFPGHVQLWGDSIEMRSPDDTQAVADILNWLKEHGPALLRDAGDGAAALGLLSRMRFACGDNGLRMQDELEEYLRELAKDAARLDWLCSMDVEVRTPLRYGSAYLFHAQTDNDEGEVHHTTLRQQIDAAMHAPGGAGGGS